MSQDPGTGGRIIKGSFWILGLELSNQGLQFLKTFYAANILTPQDFGVVGLAFLVIGFIEILSTTGMKEAIIQRKETHPFFLDTAYIIEVAKGIVVFGLCLLLSSLLGVFMASPGEFAPGVIRVIGIIYLLQCCINIGVLYFEKDIQFHRFFIYQFAGTFTDVVVSIVLVYYLQNVWALFYGVIGGGIARVIFSFLLSKHKTRFNFSLTYAKEMYHYGKYIFRGRFFNFIGLQADSVIVTSFFSLYSLGVYQMAFRIGNLPMSQVSNVIGRIAFPAFSSVHDEETRLKQYFLNFTNVLLIAIIPVVIGISVLIDKFVAVFLGSQWQDTIPIVRLLVFAGFLRMIVSLVDTLFCSLGRPKVSSELQFVRFLVFILAIGPLGYFFGIIGVACSAVLSLAVVLFIFFRKAMRTLAISPTEFVTTIIEPICFGLFIATISFVLLKSLNFSDLLELIIMAIFVVSSYVGIGIILSRYSNFKIFSKAILLIQSYRNKS